MYLRTRSCGRCHASLILPIHSIKSFMILLYDIILMFLRSHLSLVCGLGTLQTESTSIWYNAGLQYCCHIYVSYLEVRCSSVFGRKNGLSTPVWRALFRRCLNFETNQVKVLLDCCCRGDTFYRSTTYYSSVV